jgi:hypothetical protein
VVHGFGRPMIWIPLERGQAYWSSIRQHLESPEAPHRPEPDAEGLTYIARIWRSGDDSLLGFEACC